MDSAKRNSNSIFWFGMLVFTLLHLAARNVSIPWGTPGSKEAPKEIYVDYQGPTNRREDRSVVETSRIEEEPGLKDKPAHLLAKERNRVKEEMIARNRGNFQEGGNHIRQEKKGPGEGLPDGPSIGDLMPFSSAPYDAGGMKQGNHTLLNTDSVVYASYENRILREIYDPWTRFFHEALEDSQFRAKVTQTFYVAQIQVLLNRDGEVTSIQTLKSTGLPELDETIKKAFWEVGVFPNPPDQMFDEDNLIRFASGFSFSFGSSGWGARPYRF